jgi:hypothetical protein
LKFRALNQAIRCYELDRMRYFYAVADCDSEATASAIYEACDGVEYETSGVKLDLRFVPDEMDFLALFFCPRNPVFASPLFVPNTKKIN